MLTTACITVTRSDRKKEEVVTRDIYAIDEMSAVMRSFTPKLFSTARFISKRGRKG